LKDIVEKAKTYKGWGCRACRRRRSSSRFWVRFPPYSKENSRHFRSRLCTPYLNFWTG
jgi:hypothetical protein